MSWLNAARKGSWRQNTKPVSHHFLKLHDKTLQVCVWGLCVCVCVCASASVGGGMAGRGGRSQKVIMKHRKTITGYHRLLRVSRQLQSSNSIWEICSRPPTDRLSVDPALIAAISRRHSDHLYGGIWFSSVRILTATLETVQHQHEFNSKSRIDHRKLTCRSLYY